LSACLGTQLREHKKFVRNFILEFVKLKELIYEWQALERDEQQHLKDEDKREGMLLSYKVIGG